MSFTCLCCAFVTAWDFFHVLSTARIRFVATFAGSDPGTHRDHFSMGAATSMMWSQLLRIGTHSKPEGRRPTQKPMFYRELSICRQITQKAAVSLVNQLTHVDDLAVAIRWI